jgi:ATP-binding cassette subfamily B protein
LNNHPLQEWDLTAFRAMTGYVPQEVFLFSDTIERNIAFGVREGDLAEHAVQEAAVAAHVAHNIEAFDDGYATLLGERGVNLSGGQKQRISIARAFIRNPQFLVLDDCLSAVDTETEETIMSSIRERGKDAAVLIISHRISSIRGADRVLVMDQGRIVEAGAPEELLRAGGLYARMVEQQSQQQADSSH